MVVSELTTIKKIKRLQSYAKNFAKSLIFEDCKHLFIDYEITYSINIEEYIKICEIEENIDKEEKNNMSFWQRLFS